MTPAQIEAIRKDLGLDGPPYVRYARWLGLQPLISAVTGEKSVDGVLQGNLGYTLSTRRAGRGGDRARASARRCSS